MGREGPIKKKNHLHKDCCLPKPRARRHLTYTVNQRHTASAGCKGSHRRFDHITWGVLDFFSSLSNFVKGKMDHFEFYGTNKKKPGGLFFLKKGCQRCLDWPAVFMFDVRAPLVFLPCVYVLFHQKSLWKPQPDVSGLLTQVLSFFGSNHAQTRASGFFSRTARIIEIRRLRSIVPTYC